MQSYELISFFLPVWKDNFVCKQYSQSLNNISSNFRISRKNFIFVWYNKYDYGHYTSL